MPQYRNDPRWITARWAGTDANGKAFQKGATVFYFPATKTILSGAEAEVAALRFDAEAADETFMSGPL